MATAGHTLGLPLGSAPTLPPPPCSGPGRRSHKSHWLPGLWLWEPSADEAALSLASSLLPAPAPEGAASFHGSCSVPAPSPAQAQECTGSSVAGPGALTIPCQFPTALPTPLSTVLHGHPSLTPSEQTLCFLLGLQEAT